MVAAFIFVDFHLINFDYLKGLFGKAGIEMVSQSIFILDGHRDLMEQYVLFQNVFLIYLFFYLEATRQIKKKEKSKKTELGSHRSVSLPCKLLTWPDHHNRPPTAHHNRILSLRLIQYSSLAIAIM